MRDSNFRERAMSLNPMRKVYPSDKIKDAELLVALKKVERYSSHSFSLQNFWNYSEKICLRFVQADPVYNALEKDIAVVNFFFGSSTVYGDSDISCMKGLLYVVMLCSNQPFMLLIIHIRERFIEKKKKNKLTNLSFALTPTYVQ